MYVLHKEILAPLVLEEVAELQVYIPFARTIDIVQLDEIEQIVKEKVIDLIMFQAAILTHKDCCLVSQFQSCSRDTPVFLEMTLCLNASTRREGFD